MRPSPFRLPNRSSGRIFYLYAMHHWRRHPDGPLQNPPICEAPEGLLLIIPVSLPGSFFLPDDLTRAPARRRDRRADSPSAGPSKNFHRHRRAAEKFIKTAPKKSGKFFAGAIPGMEVPAASRRSKDPDRGSPSDRPPAFRAIVLRSNRDQFRVASASFTESRSTAYGFGSTPT